VTWSFHLGRILGIAIRVQATFFLHWSRMTLYGKMVKYHINLIGTKTVTSM